MRYLALSIICRLFEIATKILVKPFAKEDQNRKMLTWFLEWDRTQRQHWIATFSFPLFGGIHPKNIFATRINDLLDEVKIFSKDPIRVIDFGCGSGRTLEILSPMISAGLGIDLHTPDGNQHQIIHEKNPKITFEYREYKPENLRKRVIEYIPNLVLLSHVLEHIEKPVDYLKAIHPVPILICVPSEESWIQILRKNIALKTSSDSTHFREYTRESLCNELKEAGYSPEKIRFNQEGEIVLCARCSDLGLEKRT